MVNIAKSDDFGDFGDGFCTASYRTVVCESGIRRIFDENIRFCSFEPDEISDLIKFYRCFVQMYQRRD
jgi:hypothetical protein